MDSQQVDEHRCLKKTCLACASCVLHVWVCVLWLLGATNFRLWHAGKNGPWSHCSCCGGGEEQGATNVAFPSPLEGTIWGAGGRKGKCLVKKLYFFVYICENLQNCFHWLPAARSHILDPSSHIPGTDTQTGQATGTHRKQRTELRR